MPQSFQVISQVQIPAVMHGACCQISWLEELSVLLPGYPVGFYDILQAIQEATATISSRRVHQQLGHTPALGLNAASLLYSEDTATPFSVSLALFALIMFCQSHDFLACNSSSP